MPKTEVSEQAVASRIRRQHDAETYMRVYLSELEDDCLEATARKIGRTAKTLKHWLKQGDVEFAGGTTIFQIEGFLRARGLIEPLTLSASPTICEALNYGLSAGLITVEDIKKKLKPIATSNVLQFVHGELLPTTLRLYKLEWFLHNVRIKPGDHRLREMKRLKELHPDIVSLLIACCEDRLTLEAISQRAGYSVNTVLRWFFGANLPHEGTLRALKQLLPEAKDRKQCNAVTPTENGVTTGVVAPTRNQPKLESVPTADDVLDSIEQQITAHADIARCLILGFVSSRSPSSASDELERIRKKNPELWFELLVLVGVMANPRENYPTWRKSSRAR